MDSKSKVIIFVDDASSLLGIPEVVLNIELDALTYRWFTLIENSE